jgi:IPT/TIG domain
MTKCSYILLLIFLAHTLAHSQLEITSFFPAAGPEGTRIEIHGTSFQETRTVRFGNVSALFRIDSDSTILALVPMHAPSGPITLIGREGRANTSEPFIVRNDPRVPDEVRYKTGYVNLVERPPEFRFALLWGAAIADTRIPAHETATVEIAWTGLLCRVDGRDIRLNHDAGRIRGGLYWRDPWFAQNKHEPIPADALLSKLPNQAVSVRVGLRPDRIWHFWSASGRALIPPGHLEGCTARARVRISTGALLQLGMDYWRDTDSLWAPHERNNHEAGASHWYFSSPEWQEVIFSDVQEKEPPIGGSH